MDENTNYLASISEHTKSCGEQLDKFANVISTTSLNETEFLATERLLQVLIESGIGFAKNWLKHSGKIVRTNAYDNIQGLYELHLIDEKTLSQWKSMIGFRNILVHDYLNVDRQILNSIVEKRLYQMVVDFIQNGIKKW